MAPQTSVMATAIDAAELTRAQHALDRAVTALARLEGEFEADPDNGVLEAKYLLAKAEVDKAETKVAWIEAGKPKPSQEYNAFVAALQTVAAAQQEYTRTRADAGTGAGFLYFFILFCFSFHFFADFFIFYSRSQPILPVLPVLLRLLVCSLLLYVCLVVCCCCLMFVSLIVVRR
jgi:hypothetical protein